MTLQNLYSAKFPCENLKSQPEIMMNIKTPKPKFSRYELVNYTPLDIMLAVVNIAFHQRKKQYFYTLAVEGLEGLEPILKLVPETDLQPCQKCSNKSRSNCQTTHCPLWKLSQKNDIR